MNIFIKRLPTSITRRELELFVDQKLKTGWRLPFTGKDKINECTIIRIARKNTGFVETFGLVKVIKTKAALSLMQKLDGSSLRGVKVEACRYVQRSTLRDRRTPSLILDNFYLDNNRRLEDRRHSRMLIERAIPPVFEGLERFRRTYG